MDKLKQWIALTVVGVLAVLAAGWFLLVSPKRVDAATLRDDATAKQSENAQLRSSLAMLKAQAKDLPRQQAKLAAVAAKIPDNPAMPALIRVLTAAADQADVELVSLAPTPPTPYAGPGTAAAPASAGAAAAAPLQGITVAINVVGGYFQVEQFLDRIENLTRAVKVTAFTLTPGDNPVKPKPTTVGAAIAGPSAADTGKSLVAVITGQVFVQNPAAVASATTPVAPATTPVR